MAEFLTTVGNSFYVEQLILHAKKNLTLVTSYLKLSKTLVERIQDASKRDIKITLIYGKSELAKKEKQILSNLTNVQIYFCENLHAKCYYNEDALVITSMNLYEFSERNNREMGILVDRAKDQQLYESALNEVESIINSSVLEKRFQQKAANIKVNGFSIQDILVSTDKKYCEPYDYHFPSIKKYLELICKDHKVKMDHNGVYVLDYPRKDMSLEVSGRIDIHFLKSSEYLAFKEQNQNIIKQGLDGIRFYWNKNQINIYTEKKFNPEHNALGLENKVRKYIEIIQKTLTNTKLVEVSAMPLLDG